MRCTGRAFGGGVVAGALLLGPWPCYEATHGFEDVFKLVSGGRGDPSSALVSTGTIEAVRLTVRILGAGNLDYVVGASHDLLASEAGTVWGLARSAPALSSPLSSPPGLLTSAVRVVRGARRVRGWPFVELDTDGVRRALLLVWLGGVWLSYATSSSDRVYPHYLITVYPISFAVAALGLSDLVALAGLERGPVPRPPRGIAVLAFVLVGYVAFTLAFQRFLARHGGADGDDGTVYEDSHAVANAVRARGFRIADNPVLDFLVSGMDGRAHRVEDARHRDERLRRLRRSPAHVRGGRMAHVRLAQGLPAARLALRCGADADRPHDASCRPSPCDELSFSQVALMFGCSTGLIVEIRKRESS